MLSPILRKTDFILKWDPRRLGSFCRLARLYAEYTSFSAGLKRRVFALEKPITNCTLLDTDRPATIPNPHLPSHAPTPHGQSPNPQTTIVPSSGQSESLIEQTLQPSVGSEAISWKSSLPQFDDPSIWTEATSNSTTTSWWSICRTHVERTSAISCERIHSGLTPLLTKPILTLLVLESEISMRTKSIWPPESLAPCVAMPPGPMVLNMQDIWAPKKDFNYRCHLSFEEL